MGIKPVYKDRTFDFSTKMANPSAVQSSKNIKPSRSRLESHSPNVISSVRAVTFYTYANLEEADALYMI
jgi:hypothetical protein